MFKDKHFNKLLTVKTGYEMARQLSDTNGILQKIWKKNYVHHLHKKSWIHP